jgi:hypothetical protein
MRPRPRVSGMSLMNNANLINRAAGLLDAACRGHPVAAGSRRAAPRGRAARSGRTPVAAGGGDSRGAASAVLAPAEDFLVIGDLIGLQRFELGCEARWWTTLRLASAARATTDAIVAHDRTRTTYLKHVRAKSAAVQQLGDATPPVQADVADMDTRLPLPARCQAFTTIASLLRLTGRAPAAPDRPPDPGGSARQCGRGSTRTAATHRSRDGRSQQIASARTAARPRWRRLPRERHPKLEHTIRCSPGAVASANSSREPHRAGSASSSRGWPLGEIALTRWAGYYRTGAIVRRRA